MTLSSDEEQDVPYGEDWHSLAEATAWAEAADKKRPFRTQFRELISEEVGTLGPGVRVLELGSGPGFLAERVLERCTGLASYTLVDFSEPMLAMSRERLARFPAASFVRESFKSDGWMERIGGPFDGVVSMQAIHEIRHKRHIPGLYQQIFQVTAAPGLILICDHTLLDDSRRSMSLYMTEQEQVQALSDAGFAEVRIALSIRKLVLYVGRKLGSPPQRSR
jgi:SAM-dependent methyltransferase